MIFDKPFKAPHYDGSEYYRAVVLKCCAGPFLTLDEVGVNYIKEVSCSQGLGGDLLSG